MQYTCSTTWQLALVLVLVPVYYKTLGLMLYLLHMYMIYYMCTGINFRAERSLERFSRNSSLLQHALYLVRSTCLISENRYTVLNIFVGQNDHLCTW